MDGTYGGLLIISSDNFTIHQISPCPSNICVRKDGIRSVKSRRSDSLLLHSNDACLPLRLLQAA